jgi:integrase
MLKITKRKYSKYLQIRGTYKTPFKTYKIDYESTGTINKQKAEEFLWGLQKQLDQGIYKQNKIKRQTFDVNFVTEKLLNSFDQCPSEARKPFFEKNADCIGDTLLEDITNQKKEELIHLRYPIGTETGDLIKKYKGKTFTSIPLEERKVLSSKYNTINTTVIRPLSRLISFAAENNWCKPYKVKQLPQISMRDKDKYVWTREEIVRCMDFSDFEIKFLLIFLYRTGARIQEALDMNFARLDPNGRSMIDLDNNELNIFENKTQSWRNIPIQRNDNEPELSLWHWLQKINDREGYLFSWRFVGHKKNTNNGLIPRWREMLSFANVDQNKKRHSLRHTFASELSNKGASTNDIMTVGGWKSETMVYNYAKVDKKRKQNLINSL